jgi:tricorn protease-like protein
MKRSYIQRKPKKQRIERIPLPFARPNEMKKEQPAVKVMRDRREICNQLTKAGRDEYVARKKAMWERQGRKCGLQISPQCKERNGRWPFDEVQFGHSVSRGGGKQDDRIEVFDTETGKMKPQNKSLCPFCNQLQGSRPMSDFEEIVP